MNEREFDLRRLRRYDLPDGWTVLVGKTEHDNDYLSLKVRHPRDFWFHVAGSAGSHVLLLHDPAREPDGATLQQAAAIAAYHSKARGARKVGVSMTRAGNVSKARGAPAGQVHIKQQRQLKVAPALPAAGD